MTQEGLAAAAGLSTKTIQAIEGGNRDVPLATVLALARGVGVTAAELLSTPRERKSASALEAGKLWEMCSPEAQCAIVRLCHNAGRKRRVA